MSSEQFDLLSEYFHEINEFYIKNSLIKNFKYSEWAAKDTAVSLMELGEFFLV